MIKKYLNKLASLFNSKIISLLQSINKNLSYIVEQLRPKDEEQKALCCKYEDNDELKIYQGYDIIITDDIKIHVPLLREINEYGEKVNSKTTKKSTAPGRKPAQHSYKNTKELGY